MAMLESPVIEDPKAPTIGRTKEWLAEHLSDIYETNGRLQAEVILDELIRRGWTPPEEF